MQIKKLLTKYGLNLIGDIVTDVFQPIGRTMNAVLEAVQPLGSIKRGKK